MKAFGLGKMTLGSVFKRPQTVQYPFETKAVPEGRRGGVCCDIDTCIFCGICAKTCPASAITVIKDASTWEIDTLSCVQCEYCVRACPKSCLTMNTDLPSISTGRELGRKTLQRVEEEAPAEAVPAE